jgi:hypothetical protein
VQNRQAIYLRGGGNEQIRQLAATLVFGRK